MTELFAMVSPDRHIEMSTQVKQIVFLVSENGSRWPRLRREEYLASGFDYTKLAFSKVSPVITPGYEVQPGDEELASSKMRDWFTNELDPLQPPSNPDCPAYMRQQLQATIVSANNQINRMQEENLEYPLDEMVTLVSSTRYFLCVMRT